MPDELLTPYDVAALLDVPFRFIRRPAPVAPNARLSYRVSVLVLLLRDCCRRAQSSLKRLHFLDWAIRSEARATHVRDIDSLGDVAAAVRYDPVVDAALRFATAEGLVTMQQARVALTDSGQALAAAIDGDAELLVRERVAMKILGKHVAEGWF